MNSVNFATNLDIKPSIFEIIASEFLDKNIQSALCRIFKAIGLHKIDNKKNVNIKYSILNKYSNEISLVISIIIQSTYLKRYGSSFGEKFYGLERKIEKINFLNKNYKLFSVILLTLIPYLEEKQFISEDNNNTRKNLINHILSICKLTKPIFILLYLSDLSKYHGLSYWLSKISLKFNNKFNTNSFFFNILEMVAFFLQFVQWWQTKDNFYKINDKTTLNPIQKFEGLSKQNDNNNCPICYQKFDMPVANTLTGYVYCWKCIITHLKDKKYCPVTLIPTDIDDLIRIYDIEE